MSVIVNARELSQRLKVTPATVLAWARQGKIPCLRASRRPVLFDFDEVQKVLKATAVRKLEGLS